MVTTYQHLHTYTTGCLKFVLGPATFSFSFCECGPTRKIGRSTPQGGPTHDV